MRQPQNSPFPDTAECVGTGLGIRNRTREARRWHITDQESRLMLDQAIVTGRGGVFLDLTAEQYAELKR